MPQPASHKQGGSADIKLFRVRESEEPQGLGDQLTWSLAPLSAAIFRRLSQQQYFEIRRMSGDDYVFSLSPSGRKLAVERELSSRYAGPAPVSLKSWTAAVRAQAPKLEVTREKLKRAFRDIVAPDQLLDAVGPALILQRAIFNFMAPAGTLWPQRHGQDDDFRAAVALVRRYRGGTVCGGSGRADHYAGRFRRA